jgi:peptidoglycan/LPS O-acetylase OafA/YrhL
MNYRREIDGLRALAIVPVVLFHAGVPGFAGGFVGVDVFFVLSGYLITSIITADLEAGRFTLLSFYERRARRIMPALFVLAAACVPFAWLWMTPVQLAEFGLNLAALPVFASNILLQQQADYFGPAAELNPLLHIWSLAVEAQFYLLFPVLFLIRGPRVRTVVMLLIAVSSFAVAVASASLAPEAGFYLLPARAWELLAGALCASLPAPAPRRHSHILPGAGLLMIVGSTAAVDGGTPWPSWASLVPVAGTCLVITTANAKTDVGRLLASPALVGLGLISYSTYLWHQPLFAFARLHSLSEPSLALILGFALISFALGWLSWRLVERPFRIRGKGGGPAIPTKTFAALCVVTATSLAATGLALWVAAGVPTRVPPRALIFFEQSKDLSPTRNTCQYRVPAAGSALPELPSRDCIFGPGAKPTVALLGDSHAGALAYVFAGALAGRGVTSTQITIPGCLPFPDYRRQMYDCASANRHVLDYVTNSSIDTVVIIGRYASVYRRDRFDNGEGGVEPRGATYDAKTFAFTLPPGARQEDYALELFRRGIRHYLSAGLRVILVYPVPEAGWNVPDHLGRLAWAGAPERDLTTSHDSYLRRYGEVIALFDRLKDPALVRVRPDEVLCNGSHSGRCLISSGGRALYYDHNHPSQAGARLLVSALLEAWRKLPPGREHLTPPTGGKAVP